MPTKVPEGKKCRHFCPTIDSHIQRIVLATKETKVTQQVSHRPIKCQSRLCTKRYEGQRVTSWWQPATQTNRDLNRDKKLCTDQYQNGSKNLLTPYREQLRSTRNVAAYPRPAFSAKKRKHYAPTSFDQQVQVSQGHYCTEIRKIEIVVVLIIYDNNCSSHGLKEVSTSYLEKKQLGLS